jgi:hypothetical protein
VDFPLFHYNDEEKRWDSEHHPFTSFMPEDQVLFDQGEYGKVRSCAYDLVLNGNEIGSGSVRIHDREIQKKIFDIIGLDDSEAEQRFGFLLRAFEYGAPPHAGVAYGIDRLTSLLTGMDSIRDVIAFPEDAEGKLPDNRCTVPGGYRSADTAGYSSGRTATCSGKTKELKMLKNMEKILMVVLTGVFAAGCALNHCAETNAQTGDALLR